MAPAYVRAATAHSDEIDEIETDEADDPCERGEPQPPGKACGIVGVCCWPLGDLGEVRGEAGPWCETAPPGVVGAGAAAGELLVGAERHAAEAAHEVSRPAVAVGSASLVTAE